ncbi:MAG: hypothetical protein ACRDOE_00115 [Streptosporangiaceae bacterium]
MGKLHRWRAPLALFVVVALAAGCSSPDPNHHTAKGFCVIPPATQFLPQLVNAQSTNKTTRTVWRNILDSEAYLAPAPVLASVETLIAAENRPGSATDPKVIDAAGRISAFLTGNCSRTPKGGTR